jgi:Tfp pilus assembly protein PilN
MARQTMSGTRTQTVATPRVNLLPPEIAERSRLRKAQLAMAGTGLAAVAVVGVMYMQQSAKVADAQEAKAAAEADHVRLQSDVRALQNVADTYAQVDTAKQTLDQAMHFEVLWSGYLHDLTLTIPETVWLREMTVKMDLEKAQGVQPAVFDPGLGTVQFQGTALEHVDVASWLERLAGEKGYSNPYFTKSEDVFAGDQTTVLIHFDSTVNLTEKALSGRYMKGKVLDR